MVKGNGFHDRSNRKDRLPLMVVTVDHADIATRLAPYRALVRVLGRNWIERNTPDPPWLPGVHPLMPWCWSDDNHDFLARLDEDIQLLMDRDIAGRRILLDGLKAAAKFRSLLPELFLAADLSRAGYHLILPNNKGVKNADLRISRGGETLDIEVTAFEQTKDVQDLDLMLAALREGEPYVYQRAIPDTAKFPRSDIMQAGKDIAAFFARRPFGHGTGDGQHTVHIGATNYDIRIMADRGQGSGSSWMFAADPQRAAQKVQQRLVQEARQLPLKGGAVVLDIGTSDEHVTNLAPRWLDNAAVREALWRGVPTHVHSLWLYRWRGEDGKPLQMHYTANPYATVVVPSLVNDLRAGVLKDGYFPAYGIDPLDR